MNVQELKAIARKVAGRQIEVKMGDGDYTDGVTITLSDPAGRWPGLNKRGRDAILRSGVAHEAAHMLLFDREGKRLGRGPLTAKEFYEIFADGQSPGLDSLAYVRKLSNIVEDQKVDEIAGKHVGKDSVEESNRFLVWNRQGGTRQSIAELESEGKPGQCAAFIEALFQLEVYGELVESFYSPTLLAVAKEAAAAMITFGKGGLSREQALKRVLDALRKYCPPPWRLPDQYQPPHTAPGQGGQGNGQDQGGQGQGQPGQGQGQPGQGQGQPGQGQGQPGQGQGQPGQGQGQPGQGQGQPGQGQGQPGQGQGQPGQGQGQPGQGQPSQGHGQPGQGQPQPGQGQSQPGQGQPGQAQGQPEAKDGDGSESAGGGQGSPSGGDSRGTGTGDGAGEPRAVAAATERRCEDPNLEALLRMLERVLAEQTKKTGRGLPRWRQWSPGDQVSSPDEVTAYQMDDLYGVDPLKRRCVRQRDKELHLMGVFIDSSGSVNDALFAQLYTVLAKLAEKVSETPGTKFGVGQFSGGASWVLQPTDDRVAIEELAEQEPKRLYSGGTTVGEIYGILADDFSGYETADLIVLTDGYTEDGRAIAKSLEAAIDITGCRIKLHIVVFKKMGTLKNGKAAKDLLPQLVRTWHLGGDDE